jgi:NADH dehydrogenase (ubiquinone) Fe-S protein 3
VTVRQVDAARTKNLREFGQYVAACLPKFVQRVQIECKDELEICIHPDGVLPTVQFLKDHHNCQFENVTDILGVDYPSRKFRFEVLYTNQESNAMQCKLVDCVKRLFVTWPSCFVFVQVVYILLSLRYNTRIKVKTYTDELTPIESVCPVYTGANW